MASAEPRIDFFVAGVQKGGTTALDLLLRQHPRIQMARVKEPHYFDDDDRDWESPDVAPLHDYFDWARGDAVRGESTPIYTFWRGSLERIKAYNAAAKLVIGLRQPSFRAFAQWRMEFTRRDEILPFGDALSQRAADGIANDSARRHFSYVERGLYAEQIARALQHFPREQLFFYRTDRLWSEPQTVVTALHAFLGVEPMPISGIGYQTSSSDADVGDLPRAERRSLDARFAHDIRRTGEQTGLDLSDWLDSGYREPMNAMR